MKKLLSIATVILVAIFCITPISAADTHISSITIDCTINDDGSAVFTEVWDMHVYRGTEVYKTFKNMYQKKLTLLSVSESGHQYTNIGNWNTNANKADKANKSGIHTINGGYELCFGIGEYGHKVYTMKYSISKLIIIQIMIFFLIKERLDQITILRIKLAILIYSIQSL